MDAMSVAPPSELPIAVFDSGVGGLTVLHECLVSLPHEDFLYLGDTARFPYGDRPAAELRAFALELADILLDQGAKLLIVACNSATAAALPALREHLAGRVGVVSVVTPESRLAAQVTRNGRVGLLATEATVASGACGPPSTPSPPTRRWSRWLPPARSLIQAGHEVDERVVEQVERLCAPLRAADVDTVILGCTHYRSYGRCFSAPSDNASRSSPRVRPSPRRSSARWPGPGWPGQRAAAATTASSAPATPRPSAPSAPASSSSLSARSATSRSGRWPPQPREGWRREERRP